MFYIVKWLFAASFFLTTALHREVRIDYDPGGFMYKYDIKLRYYQKTGTRVRIDGRCYSACTMFLKLYDEGRVCAGKEGVLYFHQAREDGVVSVEGTKQLLAYYPDHIRQMVEPRIFGLPNGGWIKIKADTVLPPC